MSMLLLLPLYLMSLIVELLSCICSWHETKPNNEADGLCFLSYQMAKQWSHLAIQACRIRSICARMFSNRYVTAISTGLVRGVAGSLRCLRPDQRLMWSQIGTAGGTKWRTQLRKSTKSHYKSGPTIYKFFILISHKT